MLTRTPIVGKQLGPAILVAALVAIVAGCAATPPPPPGPPGRILISVIDEPSGENALFEPVHRARAVSADGSIDTAWRIQPGAPATEVPAGHYRFEAFTVFLSDAIVCADENGVIGGPGSTGAPGATCLQPTMGPSQVCTLEFDVVPGGSVSLVYRELDQGLCELATAGAAPT
jgi:hypothetical protein